LLHAEQRENVVQGCLVAVVPVGALGRIGIQVTLVRFRIRGFIVKPLTDPVPAATQEVQRIALGHGCGSTLY
jgi:hypothetical protein